MSLDIKKLQQIKRLDGIFDNVITEIGQRGSTPRLPTTLESLDEQIWGLHKKEVAIIGARPAEGKSSLALQIAWSLANANKRVLFQSLEMSKEQLVERLLSHVMEVNNMELRRGEITETTKNKIESFKKIAKELPLLITDNIGYSSDETEYFIQRLDPPIDVLVLDYIQLCRLGKFSNRVDSITENLRAIKELSIKHNFSALVLSQISRAATASDRKDRRPMLQDLKGSGSLEEHADTVMLLYWPYNNEHGVEPSDYEIGIEKQRHGPIGKVRLKFLPWYSKFMERIEYKPYEGSE